MNIFNNLNKIDNNHNTLNVYNIILKKKIPKFKTSNIVMLDLILQLYMNLKLYTF